MIEDKDFITSRDVPGPTKENIRAILLYKSTVTNEDSVVDIGCGSGGITIEFAQRAKNVISIDKNPEAIKITGKNLEKFNLKDKVDLIENDAVSALKKLDKIDIAIVGGSSNDLEEILEEIDKKLNPKGRILITSILLDTKIEAINALKKLGYKPKIVEVNISNGRILDRGVMMFSENPIGIISSKKDNND
ncbi:MAG: precorrin-6Y C5,15-methyltransferase (decarboxylating) subunit CbiT [Methanobacteriaceae archaeon]|jgi:cobalt-precorrin-6B (C15)-methyltransferase|nr:precorrin-6Y C5,15-methyltransferase (decarboxylating) subunit CbiT [Methanobacteriaceae archaeon]